MKWKDSMGKNEIDRKPEKTRERSREIGRECVYVKESE